MRDIVMTTCVAKSVGGCIMIDSGSSGRVDCGVDSGVCGINFGFRGVVGSVVCFVVKRNIYSGIYSVIYSCIHGGIYRSVGCGVSCVGRGIGGSRIVGQLVINRGSSVGVLVCVDIHGCHNVSMDRVQVSPKMQIIGCECVILNKISKELCDGEKMGEEGQDYR